ncbi:MAG: radical SAM protein [Candidatus Eisenbacteria bacterium]
MSGFRRSPAPLFMIWEATHDCNLDCSLCYLRGIKDKRTGTLKTTEIKRIVGEAARAGLFCLVISGGEPLLRNDVFEVREYAKRLGLLASLTTNGLLIDRSNIAEISEFDQITVSIDGMHENAYRGMGRAANAGPKDLADTIRALRDLSPGLMLNAQIVVHAGNWPNLLDDNAKFYNLGVDAVFQLTYDSRFEIDRALWYSMIDRMQFRNAKLGWIQRRFLRLFPQIAEGSFVSPCLALTSNFVVSPEGHLLPCNYQRVRIADLRERPFPAVWEGLGGLRKRYSSRKRACTCANTCFVMPAMVLA